MFRGMRLEECANVSMDVVSRCCITLFELNLYKLRLNVYILYLEFLL